MKKADLQLAESLKMVAESIPLKVFDEDSGKEVTVSADVQREFWDEYNNLQSVLFQASRSLYKIKESKLYLGGGFSSFNQFYSSLGISRSAAKYQAKLGGKIEKGSLSDPSEEQSSVFKEIGQRRMWEVARLGQEQFNAIVDGMTIESESGEQLSAEIIKSLPQEELAKRITRFNTPQKEANVSKMKQDIALLKEEQKELIARLEKQKQAIEDAQALENKFGPVAANYQSKMAALHDAMEHISGFYTAINRAAVTDEDQKEIVEYFSFLWGSMETFMQKNKPVAWQVISAVLGE